MNFNELKELISLINQSELSSFQYSKDGLKLKIEKASQPMANTAPSVSLNSAHAGAALPVTEAYQPAAPMATADTTGSDMPKNNQPAPAIQANAAEVKSPLVGVYYASPSPTSAPYLEVGKSVKKGDVLCIVEAMKVMNEIVSEHDGVVLEICAANESLVEYGQTLVRIG